MTFAWLYWEHLNGYQRDELMLLFRVEQVLSSHRLFSIQQWWVYNLIRRTLSQRLLTKAFTFEKCFSFANYFKFHTVSFSFIIALIYGLKFLFSDTYVKANHQLVARMRSVFCVQRRAGRKSNRVNLHHRSYLRQPLSWVVPYFPAGKNIDFLTNNHTFCYSSAWKTIRWFGFPCNPEYSRSRLMFTV